MLNVPFTPNPSVSRARRFLPSYLGFRVTQRFNSFDFELDIHTTCDIEQNVFKVVSF